MKINLYHTLNLNICTEIEFHHPKPKRRKQNDDAYDFNDKLIEHMENEDEMVLINTNIEDYFVHQGELQDISQNILKKYQDKLKKSNAKKEQQSTKPPNQLAENFSIKIMNYYRDSRSALFESIRELNENLPVEPSETQNIENSPEDRPVKISKAVQDLLILEASYTNKSFEDISSDIILAKGPILTKYHLHAIILEIEREIENLTKHAQNKLEQYANQSMNQLISQMGKDTLHLICDLIDKKIKLFYLLTLYNNTERKTHRTIKKEILNELLANHHDKDNLKKQIAKIDLLKIPSYEI